MTETNSVYIRDVEKEQIKYKKNSLFFYTLEQLRTNRQQVVTQYDDPVVMALLKELCYRKLGLDAYPVQLIAALRLYEGNIIEMKTGEGKTLVAILASLLHSLNRRKVHVITANDYLAKRDCDFAKPVFEELGLTCGYMGRDSEVNERIESSSFDILYTTNKEIAINYSNSRKVNEKELLIENPFDVLIVDEADLLFIDEARKELSIGISNDSNLTPYQKAKDFVALLSVDDFVLDEESRDFYLNDNGVNKVLSAYEISDYYSPEVVGIRNAIRLAFVAHHFYKKDIDYIVREQEIVLINGQTGRIAEDFKLLNGLHQAIECKEGLELSSAKSNFTKIPYQIIYNRYKTKSGMTGTALTEEKEFLEMYGLPVVAIETNKPNVRVDHPDRIHATKQLRDDAVVRRVQELHHKGQPVIIGTASIEHSEIIAEKLSNESIPYQLLNAKHHDKEAEVIKRAGELKSVTIATNMAGRGTDIKVPEESIALGGLFVLGTERYDSRRSDNQLRGRTGRQGDVGETQFYTSIEDDVVSGVNTKRIQQLMMVLKDVEKKEYIENPTIANLYNKAQIAVEGKHFDARKELLSKNKMLNTYYENFFNRKMYLLRSDFTPQEILNLLLDSFKSDTKIYASLIKETGVWVDTNNRTCKEEIDMVLFYEIFNRYWSIFVNRLDTLSVNLFLDFATMGNRDLIHQKRVNQEYSKIVLNLKKSLIEYLQQS